jgi:hypothetical protein
VGARRRTVIVLHGNWLGRKRTQGSSVSGTTRLLLFVQLSSERTLEPVRRECSFAEKQESQLARLLVVPSESGDRVV